MSKDFRNEAEIFVLIQRPIDLLVKSVSEKPYLGRRQAPSETLSKQEPSNLVLNLKLFHQKT